MADRKRRYSRESVFALAVLLAAISSLSCQQQSAIAPSPSPEPVSSSPASEIESETTPTLIGKWSFGPKLLTFRTDGTLNYRDGAIIPHTDSEKINQEYSGRYQLDSEGILSIQMDDPSCPHFVPGQVNERGERADPSGEFEATFHEGHLVLTKGPKSRMWNRADP